VTIRILNLLRNLHSDDSGQDLIEYALVAALIAFAAVGTMKTLAGSINGAFGFISNSLTNSLTP